MMKRVLIAENERITLEVLKEEFSAAGFAVKTVGSGAGVLKEFLCSVFDLVLLDMNLTGKNGLDIVRNIRSHNRDTIVIVTTTYSSVEMAVELMKAGANDYITKPYSIDHLVETARKLLSVPIQRDVRRPGQEEDESEILYGESSYMLQIKEVVRKIRDVPTTILITGENGTGKGVLARTIWKTGLRRDRPFVHVNCAAIPAALIESELFGHEKGSFTGAVKTHKGKFEMAGNGTLFLDEIGLMPLNLQSKLLNVLQERKFERIGGTQSYNLEARIIAATNVDLEQCIEDGLFRSDLYYRLNVINIELPPLRNRRSDILPLAKLFLRKYQTSLSNEITYIGNDFYEALMQHDWPGNVRELENAIERAVTLCDDGRLTLASLPMRITQRKTDKVLPTDSPSFQAFLKQQESAAILAALEQFDGHREKTAQYLGISKRTLQYKLKKLNLLNP